MPPFKPQVTRDLRPPMPANDVARAVPQDASALLIPFPDTEARQSRRQPHADEQRGEILFFLGVRYERLAS